MADSSSGNYEVWVENFPASYFSGVTPPPPPPRGYLIGSSGGGLYPFGYTKKLHFAVGDKVRFSVKRKDTKKVEEAIGIVTGVRPQWDEDKRYAPVIDKAVDLQLHEVYDWDKCIFGQQHNFGEIKSTMSADKTNCIRAVLLREAVTPETLYQRLQSFWTCGIDGQDGKLDLIKAQDNGNNNVNFALFTLPIPIF